MKQPGKKVQRKIDEITTLRNTIENNTKIVMAMNTRIKELIDENNELHELLKEYRKKQPNLRK